MTENTSARRILISGGRGFVGSVLSRTLRSDGWDVHHLVRRPARAGEVEWHPESAEIDSTRLDGFDAVVHLAGESIASLWTPAKKRRILESRVRGTSLLARSLAASSSPPGILVCASGVGYYGSAGDALLTEEAPAGDDFLAQVCVAWEAAAQPARDAGIRVVHTRFGLVLHPSGGALATMLPIFKLGLGSRLGDGRQWLSWVALRDAAAALRFVLAEPRLQGPVNVVSPNPVRNAEFTKLLAGTVRRPAWFVVPAALMGPVTGGMAESLLLASQRAVPKKLLSVGFTFSTPDLEQALADVNSS